jgi:outer membrane protein assembly factor BamD
VDARLKRDMVMDQLAGKEMTIGRFYLRNSDPIAAIGRFRVVVDRYQTTSHTPEALDRLVEAYLTVGLVDEAKRNAAVLGYNYPGDFWYHDAYRLMTSRGLRPSLTPVGSGATLPQLPFLPHRKEGPNMAPPPVDVSSAGQIAQADTTPPAAPASAAAASASPANAAPANDAPPAAANAAPAAAKPGVTAKAPPKKKDFFHDVLGL